MTHQRLTERIMLNRQLNEWQQRRKRAAAAGHSTAYFDREISRIIGLLRQKERPAYRSPERSTDRIPDELLDRLGEYFKHQEIYEKHQITFERFVILVRKGLWEAWVS